MKKLILLGAAVCVLGMMIACDKQKDECNLDGFYKFEWNRASVVTIDMAGAPLCLTPPYAYLYEGEDISTDDVSFGLFHCGRVNDLCSIEKAPHSGWRGRMKLQEGHGYIFRHTEDDGTSRYCRFILKEWKHDSIAKGIEYNGDGQDTTIVGIYLLIDNEWDGL